MRPLNTNILTTNNISTGTGQAVDATHFIQVSVQAVSTGTPTGSVKLQVSNDPPITLATGSSGMLVPINWTDLSGAIVAVSTAGAVIIPKTDVCYQWIRAIYTNTGAGAQTVAPIADTGVLQHQTVTTVADVAGSLNSTYFLLSSLNTSTKAQKNFYMWFDDGAGVDPAPAGRTAIHITYSDGDTANTIAASMRTALNALSADFTATGSNAAVIINNVAPGPVTAATDGITPTGFTFGAATTGVVSNLNNTYWLLQDAASAHSYYVWSNVSGIGTDPAVAGRTGVPIAFTAGATAATIGTAIASAVGALNSSASFTATGTTTVTITNKVTGAWVPATDGTSATHFTFTTTAGTGTTVINLKTNGV